MPIPALIAGGVALAGSAYQAYRNKKEARRAEEHDTQMSNTAYQRSSEDMKAAGLNPMMMYQKGGGGPASTPAAREAATPQYGSQVHNVINSAFSNMKTMQELQSGSLDAKIKGDTTDIIKDVEDFMGKEPAEQASILKKKWGTYWTHAMKLYYEAMGREYPSVLLGPDPEPWSAKRGAK